VKNPNRNDDRTPIFGGAEKVRQREDWVGEGFKRREREREEITSNVEGGNTALMRHSLCETLTP